LMYRIIELIKDLVSFIVPSKVWGGVNFGKQTFSWGPSSSRGDKNSAHLFLFFCH